MSFTDLFLDIKLLLHGTCPNIDVSNHIKTLIHKMRDFMDNMRNIYALYIHLCIIKVHAQQRKNNRQPNVQIIVFTS